MRTRPGVLERLFSKCGPWTRNVSNTWKLVRNANSQSLPQKLWVRAEWVLSLGWEDPLEEGMASHSRILAWGIHRDRGA